eukprot:768273-Hanusia_phi.AAC.5
MDKSTEILIVDDNSQDGSEEAVNELQKEVRRDLGVRLFTAGRASRSESTSARPNVGCRVQSCEGSKRPRARSWCTSLGALVRLMTSFASDLHGRRPPTSAGESSSALEGIPPITCVRLPLDRFWQALDKADFVLGTR